MYDLVATDYQSDWVSISWAQLIVVGWIEYFCKTYTLQKCQRKIVLRSFYSFCFRNDARVDDYKLNDQKASRIKSNLRTSKLFVFYRWFPLLIVLEHYRLVDFLWGFEYIEKINDSFTDNALSFLSHKTDLRKRIKIKMKGF